MKVPLKQLPDAKFCPFCSVAYVDAPIDYEMTQDTTGFVFIRQRICPRCKQSNFSRVNKTYKQNAVGSPSKIDSKPEELIYPKSIPRKPIPNEVTSDFADDFREACLVLADSPKASAALSRRCLQHILREKAGVKEKTLDQEIQKVIDSNSLPSHLAEALDAIRVIGNFAAHPSKSISTGDIVEVEAGEAEWNLDTIESLFDFYFVLPAATAQKKILLNQKLKDAGKPSLK